MSLESKVQCLKSSGAYCVLRIPSSAAEDHRHLVTQHATRDTSLPACL
jgi:hypothetical protein